ncbi:MAG TPA: PaaX family transcriptional regulator C-terminal domain-containing protein [Acidimicrobiales bacterium]|nr:PaaX family transcriptional regulator C-terminal domain-containing protein [Acidimicrobiales bacterium]
MVDEVPLTARSVIATTLLGAARPSRLPVGQLVHAGSLFGIGESAIRTALSRMVAASELAVDGGTYRLAGRLRDREQRVDESYAAPRRPWDGTWELAVVRAERRPPADRQELRWATSALRLASLREGVWARPDNLDHARLPHQQATVDRQCVRFFGATTPTHLAADSFGLAAWSTTAARLREAMEGGFDDLVSGFRLSIAVVRHLQADPLLPDELLPHDWPGPALRHAYEHHDQQFKRALTRSLRTPAY